MSLISIFIIAIALSMDTFSLSLSISLLTNNKLYYFPILVGIFHFIFPLIGSNLGYYLLKYININPNKLLGIIFLLLFIKLLKDKNKNDKEININTISIIILSIFVSIDSFITGIGIINFKIYYSFIISMVSFLLTFIGLKIGSQAKKDLDNISSIIGLTLLLILSIIHLYK